MKISWREDSLDVRKLTDEEKAYWQIKDDDPKTFIRLQRSKRNDGMSCWSFLALRFYIHWHTGGNYVPWLRVRHLTIKNLDLSWYLI